MQYGLFLIFLCFGINVQSKKIDLKDYVNKYPKQDFVTLSHTIKLNYFIDDKNTLKAKSVHRIEQLSLVDNCDELGLIQIPFSSFESVNLKSARYYELDSTGARLLKENIKIKFAEEKDYFINGIYYSDLKVKQFGPNVDIIAGSIVSYSYEIIYHDLKFINRFMPQLSNEHVESFKLTVVRPKEVSIEIFDFNLPQKAIASEETGKSNISSKKELHDLKPILRYSFAAPPLYNQAHYVVTTKGYTIKKEYQPILNTTQDLYNWYITLVNELNHSDEFMIGLSKEIVGSANTEEEKIERIYTWVQENLVYVAFEDGIAGFKPEEATEVVNQKFGDCKGISNVLVNLLNHAGVHAYHAWIGTRRLPYNYTMPSLVVDNHMICAVNLDGLWLYLDGTDPNTSWDLPSSHIQGKRVLIARGSQYEIQSVPESEAIKNRITAKLNVNLSNTHFASIQGTMHFSGYNKNDLRGWQNNVPIHEQKKIPLHYAENQLNYLFCQKVNLNFTNEEAVIELFGEVSGNYFISDQKMVLFWDLANDFKNSSTDSVNYPRYYHSKFNKEYITTYQLPSQSQLAELPQDISYKSKSGKFQCEVQFELKDNLFICKKKVINHSLLIMPEELDEWRDFISRLIKINGSYVEIQL